MSDPQCPYCDSKNVYAWGDTGDSMQWYTCEDCGACFNGEVNDE